MDFFSAAHLKALANEYLVPFALNLVIAIAVFIIGKSIAKLIVRGLRRMMDKRMDPTLSNFLGNVAYSILLVVVAITALERLGVKTTAAIAVLGAAGLAVGLALQGSLGNFASGVMLILFRPYKIGDMVRISGETGVVEEIQVFNTVIVTPDNRRIIVPNGKVTSDVIENVNGTGTRRIDLTFGIGYGDDMQKAKQLIEQVLAADDRILKDPAPTVAVGELADSSVNFVVRPWVEPEHYWDVMWYVTEAIKQSFDDNGISIPFPQQDVHMHQAA